MLHYSNIHGENQSGVGDGVPDVEGEDLGSNPLSAMKLTGGPWASLFYSNLSQKGLCQ